MKFNFDILTEQGRQDTVQNSEILRAGRSLGEVLKNSASHLRKHTGKYLVGAAALGALTFNQPQARADVAPTGETPIEIDNNTPVGPEVVTPPTTPEVSPAPAEGTDEIPTAAEDIEVETEVQASVMNQARQFASNTNYGSLRS